MGMNVHRSMETRDLLTKEKTRVPSTIFMTIFCDVYKISVLQITVHVTYHVL